MFLKVLFYLNRIVPEINGLTFFLLHILTFTMYNNLVWWNTDKYFVYQRTINFLTIIPGFSVNFKVRDILINNIFARWFQILNIQCEVMVTICGSDFQHTSRIIPPTQFLHEPGDIIRTIVSKIIQWMKTSYTVPIL